MDLSDIVTHGVEVIDPDSTLKDAAKKMQLLNVGVLPVARDDQVIGMLTDRDIIVQAVANDLDLERAKARDIMSTPVVSCFEDQDPRDVIRLMEEKKVRRVVVLNRDGHLVGIVSISDIAIEDRFERLAGEVLRSLYEGTSAAAA